MWSRRMNAAEKIINRLGGLTKLSRALGHRNVTTVQGWKIRGVIPARQQAAVVAIALDQKIRFAIEDFIPSEISEDKQQERIGR